MKKFKTLFVLLVGVFLMTMTSVYAQEEQVVRIAGSNRYETAVRLSEKYFKSSETLVLASGESFPDALVGGVLAGYEDASLLTIPKNALPQATKAEIKRLGTQKVFVLGGPSAIQDSVIQELEKLGLTTVRLAGDNRYQTAEKVADYIKANHDPDADKVYYADGRNYPDALAAVPYVVETKGILLLNNGQPLITGIAIGGEKSVPGKVTRISGPDRYATARSLADKTDNEKAILVNGESFPDALAASAVACHMDADIILTPQAYIPVSLQEVFFSYDFVLIAGGESSVSKYVEQTVVKNLNKEIVPPPKVIPYEEKDGFYDAAYNVRFKPADLDKETGVYSVQFDGDTLIVKGNFGFVPVSEYDNEDLIFPQDNPLGNRVYYFRLTDKTEYFACGGTEPPTPFNKSDFDLYLNEHVQESGLGLGVEIIDGLVITISICS